MTASHLEATNFGYTYYFWVMVFLFKDSQTTGILELNCSIEISHFSKGRHHMSRDVFVTLHCLNIYTSILILQIHST